MSEKDNTPHKALAGVYPEARDLLGLRHSSRELNIFARRAASSQLAGNARTRFRGRGMEFEEVRLYQPGDDIRTIDWGVTARTQVTHTKLFREEQERPVLICVDLRSPMFFGSRLQFKSWLAAELGSLIAWSALAHSDRIGGLIFGDNDSQDVRPKRNKGAALQLVHGLLDFCYRLDNPGARYGQSMFELLEETRRIAKPGSAVFIISDFHDFDAECEKRLFQLHRHTDTTLLQCVDSLEKDLPPRGRFTMTNGRERVSLITDNQQVRQRYHQIFEQRQRSFQQSCQRLGVPLYEMHTHQSALEQAKMIYGRNRPRAARRPQQVAAEVV